MFTTNKQIKQSRSPLRDGTYGTATDILSPCVLYGHKSVLHNTFVGTLLPYRGKMQVHRTYTIHFNCEDLFQGLSQISFR